MVKPKDKPESDIRTPGPKGKRPIIPADFQIRRHDNPMRLILDESEGRRQPLEASEVNQTSLLLETSQVREISEDLQTRLDSKTSLANVSSQDLVQSPVWSKTSLVPQGRQVVESDQHKTSVDLMASLPDVKGFLRLYFQLIDHLYPQLDPFERAVHETLYRLSWGFNKSTCTISYQRIAERTGMSSKSAQRAAGRLESKGLVSKSGRVIGYHKEQGIEFSVVPPPRQVLESRQVRQSRQDTETYIIDRNTQIKNTQTQNGVGVISRFSLEECQQYANHLKQTGQGITNPGGYATKIFRSGEADAFIEAFLSPLAQLDISKCEDCRGTGFIYIDSSNPDKGVKQCKHNSLQPTAQ